MLVQKGKTNWLYLAVVIFAFFISTAGILYFVKSSDFEVPILIWDNGKSGTGELEQINPKDYGKDCRPFVECLAKEAVKENGDDGDNNDVSHFFIQHNIKIRGIIP